MSEPTFLTPKEKKVFERKKEKFKLILTLGITNFFTFTLCQFDYSPPTTSNQEIVTLKENHLWVQGQLELFLPFENKSLSTVTLLNSEGEVVIEKAYLYEKTIEDSVNSWGSNLGGSFYKIQIPQTLMDIFAQNSHRSLMAYPYFEKRPSIVSQEKNSKTKRKAYEIHF